MFRGMAQRIVLCCALPNELTFNQVVVGSIPTGLTGHFKDLREL
jgi:hypothetical protein